jgi:Arc/MetJ family transcription regulator
MRYRITIDIDERLLQRAMRFSGNRTKNATVDAALRLLIATYPKRDGKGTTSVVPKKSR